MVIFFEGDSPTIGGTQRGMRRLWRCLIARYTDAFLTNSHGGRKYLVTQLGINEDRIFVKPCEVPNPSISPLIQGNRSTVPGWANCNRPVFLFIGQLIERKGISYLLDACSLLKHKGYSEWSLVIVGDGSGRVELQNYTRSMKLQTSIHWEGWISNDGLGTYIKYSDVFVFPTLEDTWGVAVLEAMFFEKPILCSKFAGASEMIKEGENGFVFDPYRPEILAELMKKFIDDPALIKSMGQKSKQLINPFTPEATARHVASVIGLQ
jgi:glycosyltransferase involved in cell wall biosynthesis